MNIITRLWLSFLHDSGGSRQAGLCAPGESRSFAEATARLEQRLRAGAPSPAAPAGLHGGIMGAVRAASQPAPAEHLFRAGALAGPAFALLLVGVMLLYSRQIASDAVGAYSGTPPLATGSAALTFGAELADSSGLVFNPLAEELRKVNRDLAAAAERVFSALP